MTKLCPTIPFIVVCWVQCIQFEHCACCKLSYDYQDILMHGQIKQFQKFILTQVAQGRGHLSPWIERITFSQETLLLSWELIQHQYLVCAAYNGFYEWAQGWSVKLIFHKERNCYLRDEATDEVQIWKKKSHDFHSLIWN